MAYLSEAAVEQLVLDHLAVSVTRFRRTPISARTAKAPERDAYADVVLIKRLAAAIEKLNPADPADARGMPCARCWRRKCLRLSRKTAACTS